MRSIHATNIASHVRQMCIKANYRLEENLVSCIQASCALETFQPAKETLNTILKNIEIAQKEKVPLCQDTGMVCVFVELGNEVIIEGGGLIEAINTGVRLGYESGYLRKSMVKDPLRRENTKTNEPAFIHVDLVSGDHIRICVAPKGAGSENMSKLKMLKPADGAQGVESFVLDTVRCAGPNPCPPIIVGVGIGGNFDQVALLAKKALLRPIDQANFDPYYAKMEKSLLKKINKLGIGPAGFGGKTSALSVHIEQAPTHIACLPVAVNISCHVNRHEEVVL